MNKWFVNLSIATVIFCSSVSFVLAMDVEANFYVGKIPNRTIWLVKERVTPSNLQGWQKYAAVQGDNSTIQAIKSKTDGKVNTKDGSEYFKMVLNDVDIHKNEVWVAYATTSPNPSPNDKKFDDYPNYKYYPQWFENPRSGTQADNIKMFVTIVSSPLAKIISYMGICVSAESIFMDEREKNLSMPLQAFGAGIMLKRNPEREFQVHAPTPVMGQIMMNALPQGTTFIGTRPLRIEEFTEGNPFCLFQLQKAYRKIDTEAQKAKDRFDKLKSKCNGNYQQVMKEVENWPSFQKKYLIFNDETQEVSQNIQPLKDQAYQEEFLCYFNNAKAKSVKDNPYVEGKNDEAAKKILEDYPSIISVNSVDPLFSLEYFKIYNPKTNNLWLDIKKSDKDYNWLFTQPFASAGITTFVAVDLQALANCCPLE